MQEVSTLTERGEAAYAEPITITQENVILDGYALWELARLRGRATVPCIVRDMDQEAALLYLLDKNRGSRGISDYSRILMALDLEPWFRERAKVNQSTGGRQKGSTQLAEADRLDARIEVARAAGVSAGNVSKVKQIVQSAIPEIREALLGDEISINRAAVWSQRDKPTQLRQLSDYRNENGIRRTIALLLKKHEPRHPRICDGLREIQCGLRKLHGEPHLSAAFAALLAILREIDTLMLPDEVDRAA